MLLRKKAAEELKKEQERKAAERRRIIEQRCGKPKNIEDASEGMIFLNYHLFLLFVIISKENNLYIFGGKWENYIF